MATTGSRRISASTPNFLSCLFLRSFCNERQTIRKAIRDFMFGALVLAGLSPSRALAQDDRLHAPTPQHHEETSDHRNKANALVKIVRESTERFRNVEAAEAEHYGLLFGCVSGPDWGAMGLHYVNLAPWSAMASWTRALPRS